MSPISAPRLLWLPQTLNGYALGCLLITSFVFIVIQIGLTAPSIGTWQGFILYTMGPALLIHHLAVFWYLFKARAQTSTAIHVHDCLIRKLNIGFLVVLHLVWVAGTVLGFLILPLVLDGPWDGGRRRALAWSSAAFGLMECVVLGVIVVFCIRARREKSRSDADASRPALGGFANPMHA
ncbi:mannosyltransferase domain protein [Ceratobasidium sp. AG-Ba]|nr:mannosyltransferase domain protein [Ceratobasidium sp. AG-Ba]